MTAIGLVIAGLILVGCSSSPSTTQKTTTTSSVSGGTTSAIAWLTTKAEPWNHILNADQGGIDAASKTTSGVSGATYFSRLRSACTKMFDDASKAGDISTSPSSELDEAWRAMAAQTKAYASRCLTLTRTHSNADLAAWNSSLNSMNSASGLFNSAVATVRKGAGTTPG